MNYKILKHILDKTFALLLIIISFPLQLFIFFVLFAELKEFPIFSQKRGITLEKFSFTIFKFKTIKSKDALLLKHKTWKEIFFIDNVQFKITRFARLLRKTGLDELLQIYNVLFGSLSFIGPRPLMYSELEIIKSEFPLQYKKRNEINSLPGITGLWQIFGDRRKGIDNLLELDLLYEKRKSFKVDFHILSYTIPIILFAKNSDVLYPRIELFKRVFSYSEDELQKKMNSL